MTAASYEVCAAWATSADVVGSCCKGGMSNTALATDAFLAASGILYNLSGRRWPGVCTDTIRPTAEWAPRLAGWTPFDGYGGPWPSGGNIGYDLYPGMWGYCGCDRSQICGCSSVSEIRLPGYPVVSVTSVKIDGDVQPANTYKVQDRARLVSIPSTSNRAGWPCCQDVTLPDTEDGTFSVVYAWGAAPPRMGVRAAAALGCELYKGWAPNGDDVCMLPEHVTSVTRQGVTVAVLDTFDIFEKGMTGIAAVDLWLSSLKAGRAEAGASVIVPDQLPRYRRDQP